jgi:hypothetical protein
MTGSWCVVKARAIRPTNQLSVDDRVVHRCVDDFRASTGRAERCAAYSDRKHGNNLRRKLCHGSFPPHMTLEKVSHLNQPLSTWMPLRQYRIPADLGPENWTGRNDKKTGGFGHGAAKRLRTAFNSIVRCRTRRSRDRCNINSDCWSYGQKLVTA